MLYKKERYIKMVKTSYTKNNSYNNFEGGKEVELKDLKAGDIFKVYNDKFYLVCEYSQPDKFHTSSFHIPCVSLDNFTLYHFEGDVTDNDVHFDYKIKSGPATNRNAIKLLGVLGYDDQIVDDAQNLADRFLSTGNWS